VIEDRPKCFVPITNTASGTPYLVGISPISRDSHEITKDEPNCSEKPNNSTTEDCSDIEEWYTFRDEQEYNARHGKE
jgi:hypothetical protein